MEELEQPTTVDSAVEDLPEVDEEIVSTDEPDQETPEAVESDDEEIDYEGEKYKVPKKLKDAFLRQADYTVKTQAIAEKERNFAAAQEQLAQRQQFQAKHFDKFVEIKTANQRLEQFNKLDWNALTDADPVQAMKLDREMRAVQQVRDRTIAAIDEVEARDNHEAQQATARRLADAAAQLKRDIPNWSSELDAELKKAAMSYGFSEAEARVSDPRTVKMVHDAYLYRKLMAKAKTAEKPDVKPITRIAGATATAEKSPSAMTDSEFAKWRQRQIAQRK